jgi:hypothetical protein
LVNIYLISSWMRRKMDVQAKRLPEIAGGGGESLKVACASPSHPVRGSERDVRLRDAQRKISKTPRRVHP